jgi:hypothetical protein
MQLWAIERVVPFMAAMPAGTLLAPFLHQRPRVVEDPPMSVCQDLAVLVLGGLTQFSCRGALSLLCLLSFHSHPS